MSRYMQQLTCRFHPEAVLVEDYRAGDMICPLCGLVVGERMIDVGSEWRDFGNESDGPTMNRVGAAQNLLYDNDDLNTTTSIGTGVAALDEFGRQKYNKKLSQTSSADKALRNAHNAIREMAGRINLTKNVVSRAFLVFKHCYETKCLRGRSQEAIVASCIYTACRLEGSTRTIKEISDISSISQKEIGRIYIKIKKSLPTSTAPKSVEIKNLVPRFCNQLELEQENLIRKTAIHIAERANEICDIQGRAPSSVAGASIYMACLAACEKKTKKDIQGPTGASESVIREIYRIMLPHAAELFPKDFVFKCPLNSLASS